MRQGLHLRCTGLAALGASGQARKSAPRRFFLDSSMVEHCGEFPGLEGGLQYLRFFLDSSMVEHSAVNRGVVGSSPTRGDDPKYNNKI